MRNNRVHYIIWKEGRKGGTDLLNMIYAKQYAIIHENKAVVYLDDMIKNKILEMKNQNIESEYWDIIIREMRG